MTSKLSVIDYNDQIDGTNVYQSYTVTTNSYWVTIKKNQRGTGRETDEVVFEREPQMEEWLDEKHSRIAAAVKALEDAIIAAVGKEEVK